MEKQPVALLLAARLDLYATGDKHQRDIEDAAAELRRLSKVEDEWAALSQDEGKAEREIDRLNALNAQLLGALDEITDVACQVDCWQSFPGGPIDRAVAAIEAANERLEALPRQIVARLEQAFSANHAAPLLIRKEFLEPALEVKT